MSRAIHIKINLEPDEKKRLQKYFRQAHGCGIREGFRRACIDAQIRAADWESDRDAARERHQAIEEVNRETS